MKNQYKFATDADMGIVRANTLQEAYDMLREEITDEHIGDGATLWVESEDGDRITMRGVLKP